MSEKPMITDVAEVRAIERRIVIVGEASRIFHLSFYMTDMTGVDGMDVSCKLRLSTSCPFGRCAKATYLRMF